MQTLLPVPAPRLEVCWQSEYIALAGSGKLTCVGVAKCQAAMTAWTSFPPAPGAGDVKLRKLSRAGLTRCAETAARGARQILHEDRRPGCSRLQPYPDVSPEDPCPRPSSCSPVLRLCSLVELASGDDLLPLPCAPALQRPGYPV